MTLGASLPDGMSKGDREVATTVLSLQADVQALQVSIASGDLTPEEGGKDLSATQERYSRLLSSQMQDSQP